MELVRPKDEESWSTLVRAAAVRKHKPLLYIAETLNEEKIPSIYYHRKCRSVFTMKKLLETISKWQGTDNQQPTTAKRTSIRQSPTTSTTYEQVCIFCEKKSKYLKGTRKREPLVQCRDLCADHSIRKSAMEKIACARRRISEPEMEKKDSRILAIASREIVAAEACYHRACYKGYTRAEASPTVASDGCGESLEDEYANLESEAYQMLFGYIRSDVLANEKIVRLTEMTELLASYLTSLGVEEIKLSSKKHIRRNLQAECGDVLFENLLETASVFIVPANLSPLQVAKYITTLLLHGKTGQCKPVFSERKYTPGCY